MGRLALVGGAPGVVFDAPEEGVAPGQACVLYAPEAETRVLGGGFIAGTVRSV
jgi:tRNA-specific 2-thiouridylase